MSNVFYFSLWILLKNTYHFYAEQSSHSNDVKGNFAINISRTGFHPGTIHHRYLSSNKWYSHSCILSRFILNLPNLSFPFIFLPNFILLCLCKRNTKEEDYRFFLFPSSFRSIFFWLLLMKSTWFHCK